ncbi:WXG100 family type VII secretion target [Mycolicibacterium boenickei]
MSQVVGSNPESLLTASLNARAAAQRVNSQIDKARGQFAQLKDDWTGNAADAAQKQGREMFEDQAGYRDKLYEVAAPLAAGGTELTELRSDLKSAVDSAEDLWDVSDDGSVKAGFWLSRLASMSKVTAMVIESKRITVECHIKLKLAQFEAADRDTAYKVRKVGWGLT